MRHTPWWFRIDYALDESDPDFLVLRREDGSTVATFSAWGAARENILEAADRATVRNDSLPLQSLVSNPQSIRIVWTRRRIRSNPGPPHHVSPKTPLQRSLSVGYHGAEFEARERLAVLPYALGVAEHWSARLRPD